MNETTRRYLRGRFGDHYRRAGASPPPAANEREWGYIPFSAGETRMVRHRSLLDLGGVAEFLARERPRHVYYSAARYDDPGAASMGAKGWRGADLVFDLDADHLPDVDPDEDSYREMLETCKDALLDLLSFLEDDFGFQDIAIAFSGGRGYHVHVRDDEILELGREARREIVDYILGQNVTIDAITEKEVVSAEFGRKTPAERRTLKTEGGWGRRMMETIKNLREMEDQDAIKWLQGFENVGEKRAETILDAVTNQNEELADEYEGFTEGNIELGGQAAHVLLNTVVKKERVPIGDPATVDEPVTTDVNRLIRLPGSLHGGTALRVTPIDRDALEGFDPFVDAVPATFRGQEIVLEVREPGGTPFPAPSGGDSFTVEAGEQTVPEYVGAFLMARGRAEKGKEG